MVQERMQKRPKVEYEETIGGFVSLRTLLKLL